MYSKEDQIERNKKLIARLEEKENLSPSEEKQLEQLKDTTTLLEGGAVEKKTKTVEKKKTTKKKPAKKKAKK